MGPIKKDISDINCTLRPVCNTLYVLMARLYEIEEQQKIAKLDNFQRLLILIHDFKLVYTQIHRAKKQGLVYTMVWKCVNKNQSFTIVCM